MEPVSFHPRQKVMRGDGKNVKDLFVVEVSYADGGWAFVSCWQMPFREALRLLLYRRVYLSVSGPTHPPVAISTTLREVGLLPSQIEEP